MWVGIICNLYAQTQIPNLIDHHNQFIFKDSKSFTWISSLGGLNRYDGNKVKQYLPNKGDSNSLQEGLIQSDFFEDGNSDIWFTTVNYLNRYNRKTDDFDHFVLEANKTSDYRLIGFDEKEKLLIQVEEQLYYFYLNSFKWTNLNTFCDGINYSLVKDDKNNIKTLFATRWDNGNGLLKFSFNNSQIISTDTLFKEEMLINAFFYKGKTWVSNSNGLYKIDTKGIIEHKLEPNKSYVRSISPFGQKDSLIVISKGAGYIYDIKLNTWSKLLIDDEVKCNFAKVISKDELYLGTADNELLRMAINKSPWQIILKRNDNIQSIYSINQNGNEKLLCSFVNEGFQIFDYRTGEMNYFDIENSRNLMTRNFHIVLNTSTQKLILVSNYGIHSIDSINNELKTHLEFSNSHFIYQEGLLILDKKYFIFDTQGLIEINEKGEITSIKYKGQNFSYPYMINNRLFAYGDSGIWEFKINSNGIEHFKTYEMAYGINQYILRENNLLYLATNSGLQILNLKTNKIVEHILPNVYIESFIFDDNNNLWIGAKNGLFKYLNKDQIKFYSKENGLPSNVFKRNAVTKTADGQLWWGTTKGLLHFHPDSIKQVDYNPPIIINSLKIHGHEWANDTINIEEKTEVNFSYDENTLTLNFSALDYNLNSHPQYKVFLKGHDVDTTHLGDQHIITYPNLDPGHYSFYYNVCNYSGDCRPKYAKFNIQITPPIWETWWFRFIYITIGIGIAYALIRFYINSQLKEQKYTAEKQKLQLQNELQSNPPASA